MKWPWRAEPEPEPVSEWPWQAEAEVLADPVAVEPEPVVASAVYAAVMQPVVNEMWSVPPAVEVESDPRIPDALAWLNAAEAAQSVYSVGNAVSPEELKRLVNHGIALVGRWVR